MKQCGTRKGVPQSQRSRRTALRGEVVDVAKRYAYCRGNTNSDDSGRELPT